MSTPNTASKNKGLVSPSLEESYDSGNITRGHSINKIIDRWLNKKGELIGYIIEYTGYTGQRYAVRTAHMDAAQLISQFERLNKHPRAIRKGVLATDDNPLTIDSYDVGGEFAHLCVGYTSNSCALIALNVHFKRRLYESFEDFLESLPGNYKERKVFYFIMMFELKDRSHCNEVI